MVLPAQVVIPDKVPDLYGMRPVFVQEKPVEFPNYSENYRVTVLIPTQEAAERAEAERLAQEVQQQANTPQIVPQLPSGDAKAFIYMHESGNNPGSINPSSGACGLGQALPCSKMDCSLSDYACQDSFFTQYMMGRYGTWENARAFWLSHNWW